MLLQEIRQEINQAKQKSGFGGFSATKRTQIDDKQYSSSNPRDETCENPFAA